MPELCRFYGIIIRMYFNDHAPPHFHAFYGEYQVLVDIENLAVLSGHFPPPRSGPSRGMGVSSTRGAARSVESGKETGTTRHYSFFGIAALCHASRDRRHLVPVSALFRLVNLNLQFYDFLQTTILPCSIIRQGEVCRNQGPLIPVRIPLRHSNKIRPRIKNL